MNVGEFSDAYDEALSLAYNSEPVMVMGPGGRLFSITSVRREQHMLDEHDYGGSTVWIEVEEF